jgi:hypothetical protein
MLASLRWTKVLARGRSTWAGTTSLLNAQSATFDNLTLKTFLGSIGLFSSNHLYESKATRLFAVRIKHDLALFNITIFFEETSDFDLRETRMNTSDEEVGTWIDCAIIGRGTAVILWWATKGDLAMPVDEGEQIQTGYQHDHYRWEMQSDEHHLEDSHCDELDVGMHCDHAHNEEPHLRDKVRVSFGGL